VDIELLRMEGRIAFDDDGFTAHLLQLIEPAGIGQLQRLDHLRMHPQQNVLALQMKLHFAHLDIDLVAHRGRALHHAGAGADVALHAQRPLQRLFDALARDGHQAKIVELQNLGWRAIRVCLDEPELFKTQLRALLRAATFGDVRIMLPLIVTLDEVRAARRLLLEASGELTARGVEHRTDVPLGVMVETPAAAIGADILAPEVAFFSIGTNDLVQYTLAVDRGNVNLAERFTPLHPSVLRLIRRTVQAGTAAGLEVAVCGEMASQPLMAFALIGLGVRQLSVGAPSVALVKRVIRGISVDVARAAAESAMLAGTAEEVEQVLRAAVRSAFGDAPFLRYGLPVKGDLDMFGDAGA